MGFRCILFICSIKYTEIEKKISKFVCNYSAPPMGMSNHLTVVLQQELH